MYTVSAGKRREQKLWWPPSVIPRPNHPAFGSCPSVALFMYIPPQTPKPRTGPESQTLVVVVVIHIRQNNRRRRLRLRLLYSFCSHLKSHHFLCSLGLLFGLIYRIPLVLPHQPAHNGLCLKDGDGVWWASDGARHVEGTAGQKELVAADLFAVLAEGLEVPEFANMEAEAGEKVLMED